EGKALTNLVQTLGWKQPARAVELAQEAAAVNGSIGNTIELVKIHAARAIAADSDDQGQLELQRGRDLSRKIGYEGGLLQLAVAEVFQRMTSSGTLPWPDELEQTAAAQIRRRDGHAYWLDVFDIWAGRSLVPRARWLGGPV